MSFSRKRQATGTVWGMPEMVPSSPAVSERMSKIRNRDTDAEMALRRELHRRGLRHGNGRRPFSDAFRIGLLFSRAGGRR